MALVESMGVAAVLAAYRSLDKYRITSYGDNPWTVDAIMNVLRIRRHIDAVVAAVGGSINSCYRSAQVNAKVGGVPPDLSKPRSGSRHLHGLAADIRPAKGLSVTAACSDLWPRLLRGEFGPFHQLIDENTWLHVSWRFADEGPATAKYMKLTSASGEYGKSTYTGVQEGKALA